MNKYRGTLDTASNIPLPLPATVTVDVNLPINRGDYLYVDGTAGDQVGGLTTTLATNRITALVDEPVNDADWSLVPEIRPNTTAYPNFTDPVTPQPFNVTATTETYTNIGMKGDPSNAATALVGQAYTGRTERDGYVSGDADPSA